MFKYSLNAYGIKGVKHKRLTRGSVTFVRLSERGC